MTSTLAQLSPGDTVYILNTHSDARIGRPFTVSRQLRATIAVRINDTTEWFFRHDDGRQVRTHYVSNSERLITGDDPIVAAIERRREVRSIIAQMNEAFAKSHVDPRTGSYNEDYTIAKITEIRDAATAALTQLAQLDSTTQE
jgi:hypothetical protein